MNFLFVVFILIESVYIMIALFLAHILPLLAARG
jgi:hypothetical protein